MFNEVLLIGVLSAYPQQDSTPSGATIVRARLRVDELADGRAPFRLWIPLNAYGKAAEKLLSCHEGDMLLIRGKIGWQKQLGESKGSLVVAARSVDSFVIPELVQDTEEA